MSLYIGNLSSRIRRYELEHVFRRFGRCNVRIKDGYGFVVYEFPPNAEKALRALQKSYICGEPLILKWSNKQPKPFKRYEGAARSNGLQHGRNTERGGYTSRKLISNDRQVYRMSIRQPDGEGEMINSADRLDEEMAYYQNDTRSNIGEEHHGYVGDFLHEGGRNELVDAGRWGEQFHDAANGNGVGKGIEFDRYEPFQGYDGKNDYEYNHIASSSGSPALQSSQENKRMDHVGEVTSNCNNDAKFHQICYKCGNPGHKMNSCPRNPSWRKLNMFDHRHEDDINRRGKGRGGAESGLKEPRSRSQEKLQSGGNAYASRHKDDIKPADSRRHLRLMRTGSSPVAKEPDRFEEKEHDGKKQGREAIRSPIRHRMKKTRSSVSSQIHTNDATPRSRSASQPSDHVQKYHSHSRSRFASSQSCLLPYDSRSSSAHCSSRSRSPKSRSRSSSPTSLSLSVSLGQTLPLSSNKAGLNPKGSLNNVKNPESKEVLIELEQSVGGGILFEDARIQYDIAATDNENEESSLKAENETEKIQSPQKEIDGHQTVLRLYEVRNPSTSVVEKGIIGAENCPPMNLTVKEVCQNSEHLPILTKNPNSEAPASSCSGHSAGISSEELPMVLKHYGLDLPDENKRHLLAEAYFGSARLWPWEFIFYRRLKKGLISVENYARRVEQNAEFGIVDKYIRSSSGWGELG